MIVKNNITVNIFIREIKNKRNNRQNIYANVYIQLSIYIFFFL